MTPLPPISIVWKAIEIYLRLAYENAPPSATVKGRLATLASAPEDQFFHNSNIERDADGQRMRIRLGNPWYPHMKLSMDCRPDGQGYLFRADTHDRHCCPPPTSPEYSIFNQMMEKNQKLAAAIESTWADAGIPTFKSYLQEDLDRRMKLKIATENKSS